MLCCNFYLSHFPSGVVATVFGSTGFLGRYVVQRLGRLCDQHSDIDCFFFFFFFANAINSLLCAAQVGSQVLLPFRGDDTKWRRISLNLCSEFIGAA
jgi:hypothetical protein